MGDLANAIGKRMSLEGKFDHDSLLWKIATQGPAAKKSDTTGAVDEGDSGDHVVLAARNEQLSLLAETMLTVKTRISAPRKPATGRPSSVDVAVKRRQEQLEARFQAFVDSEQDVWQRQLEEKERKVQMHKEKVELLENELEQRREALETYKYQELVESSQEQASDPDKPNRRTQIGVSNCTNCKRFEDQELLWTEAREHLSDELIELPSEEKNIMRMTQRGYFSLQTDEMKVADLLEACKEYEMRNNSVATEIKDLHRRVETILRDRKSRKPAETPGPVWAPQARGEEGAIIECFRDTLRENMGNLGSYFTDSELTLALEERVGRLKASVSVLKDCARDCVRFERALHDNTQTAEASLVKVVDWLREKKQHHELRNVRRASGEGPDSPPRSGVPELIRTRQSLKRTSLEAAERAAGVFAEVKPPLAIQQWTKLLVRLVRRCQEAGARFKHVELIRELDQWGGAAPIRRMQAALREAAAMHRGQRPPLRSSIRAGSAYVDLAAPRTPKKMWRTAKLSLFPL